MDPVLPNGHTGVGEAVGRHRTSAVAALQDGAGLEHAALEGRIFEGEVDSPHAVEQRRKLSAQLGAWVGRIGAESRAGKLRAHAPTGPDLGFRVLGTNEHRELRFMSWTQDQDGTGIGEARQVVEVRVRSNAFRRSQWAIPAVEPGAGRGQRRRTSERSPSGAVEG